MTEDLRLNDTNGDTNGNDFFAEVFTVDLIENVF